MKISIFAACIVLLCSAPGRGDHANKNQRPKSRPRTVESLDHTLDGEKVTVEFTIAEVHGISQLVKRGQAPSFGFVAESHKTKRLSVWVVGELANVLDRLQMSFLQDNQLKTGTVLRVTGKLTVHSMDNELFHIKVDKWQDFKVLRRRKKKKHGATK